MVPDLGGKNKTIVGREPSYEHGKNKKIPRGDIIISNFEL